MQRRSLPKMMGAATAAAGLTASEILLLMVGK
jgi:hypothetical protein